jgi:hypothetical protein
MNVVGLPINERFGGISWSRTGGYVTSRVFTGTHEAIDSMIPQLVVAAGADSFAIDREESTSTLTAVFANEGPEATEVPFDIWELPGNDLQKEIWEHPKVLGYSSAMVTVLRNEVELVQSGSSTYAESVAAIQVQMTAESLSAGTQAEILSLFDHILKGGDSFVTDQYVLRKTQLITSRYTAIIARSGVNKIWTTAQITGSETIPQFISNELGQLTAPTARTGYQWGWLKKAPTVLQVAGNKFQLTQEWWLEQWSTFVYDVYS